MLTNTPAANSDNTIQPTAANVVPLILQEHSSQTADLQEWQDSSGATASLVLRSGDRSSGSRTGRVKKK